jgi:octaprenyl-diphosphate synthase
VALAAHVGAGFTPAARTYAVAVELVHNATLLHDDVVDLGDTRRGAPAACVVYGNAASIFGGDWMLVDALRRIQSVGRPHVLSRMLEVIQEMVVAESLQLERRGEVHATPRDYFRIIEGKTASLFRWAMFAGADAGGVDLQTSRALETYGEKLGTAFQLVDDLLDFSGDPATTGKSLLADLREGKITYPLILALERDRSFAAELEAHRAVDALPADLASRIGLVLTRTAAHDDCLALASRFSREAVASLAVLPAGKTRSALEDVALAAIRRKR